MRSYDFDGIDAAHLIALAVLRSDMQLVCLSGLIAIAHASK